MTQTREPLGWLYRKRAPVSGAIRSETFTRDKTVAMNLDPHPTPLFAFPPDAADAIEAAMREPVATVVKNDSGQIRLVGKDWLALDLSAHVGTKLFAFPPDAVGEIERLTKRLDVAEMDRFEQGQEIDHLRFIVKMLLHYIDTGDMRELDLRIARSAIAPTEDK
jgi:hypothetical protein